MIKISNADRTFIDFESWEDLITTPGYVSEFDPQKIKLSKILGKYALADLKPCGIKSYRQLHSRGFIVEGKDASGEIIIGNIGNICGKRL